MKQPPQQNTNIVESNKQSDFLGSGILDQFQQFKVEMRNMFQEQVKMMKEQVVPQPQVIPQPQPLSNITEC